jgi:hypothetical protein
VQPVDADAEVGGHVALAAHIAVLRTSMVIYHVNLEGFSLVKRLCTDVTAVRQPIFGVWNIRIMFNGHVTFQGEHGGSFVIAHLTLERQVGSGGLGSNGAQWAVIGGEGGVSNILPCDPKYYTFLKSLAKNG